MSITWEFESVLWRYPLLALLLVLAGLPLSRPALAVVGAPDEVSGKLMYSISPEEMAGLLQEVGFTVVQKQDAYHWVVLSSNRYTMAMRFVGCKEERCEGVRVRAVWSLGERPLALAAVTSFERSVPIAQVSLHRGKQGIFLLVGRDIWMLPGRTAANVAAQLSQTDVLAESMTQLLRKNDPGISEFWEGSAPK